MKRREFTKYLMAAPLMGVVPAIAKERDFDVFLRRFEEDMNSLMFARSPQDLQDAATEYVHRYFARGEFVRNYWVKMHQDWLGIQVEVKEFGPDHIWHEFNVRA